MVLSTLLFALGFCGAALCAVLMVPFVWRRAVRLTRQRLEATLPLSLKDISAERDELRAEYAVAQRALEHEADVAREAEAMARIEIGTQVAHVDSLSQTLRERDSDIVVFEDTVADQEARISQLSRELDESETALSDARVNIAELRDEVSHNVSQIATLTAQTDNQRIEIAALETRASNLSDELDARNASFTTLELAFAEEQAKRRKSGARVASLARSLQVKDRELARSAERMARLESDQAKSTSKLRREVEAKGKELRDLHSRITVQAAESVRQGKRSTSLEQQFAAAATDMARMESLLQDTERRAAAEIERAREALEIERSRRLALARELAVIRGHEAEREPLPTDIKPFQPKARPAHSLAWTRAGKTEPSVTPTRIIVQPTAGDAPHNTHAGAAKESPSIVNDDGPKPASHVRPATVGVNGKSIHDRIAKLQSQLSAGAASPNEPVARSGAGLSSTKARPGVAGSGATAAQGKQDLVGSLDKGLQDLSDSDLQSRIRDLADTFSVFDRDEPFASKTGLNGRQPDTMPPSIAGVLGEPAAKRRTRPLPAAKQSAEI